MFLLLEKTNVENAASSPFGPLLSSLVFIILPTKNRILFVHSLMPMNNALTDSRMSIEQTVIFDQSLSLSLLLSELLLSELLSSLDETSVLAFLLRLAGLAAAAGLGLGAGAGSSSSSSN
jgi:hypothetical protein